jgi:hypothetical protein
MWWCTACCLHRSASSSCLLRCAVESNPSNISFDTRLDSQQACWCQCRVSVSIGTPARVLDEVQACHQIPSQVDVLVLTQLPLMPDLQAQDRAALRDLTANLNDRHRNAQFAGRASAELHTLIFFSKQAIAADARIVKVVCYAVVSPYCWQPSWTCHTMLKPVNDTLAAAVNCLLCSMPHWLHPVLQDCC